MEIRRLTPADVGAVLRLRDLAGWNQTEQDVRRLLALAPDGCFAAWEDGEVVGTATTTAYGSALAWVGMVLVDPRYRRRGIASALSGAAVEHLRRCGVATIKLDATPAGRPVYERLGFVPEGLLERWAGTAAGDSVGVESGGWEEIAAADLAAFGTDRGALLRMAMADAAEPPLVVRDDRGAVAGYALIRPGLRAWYVGPVVAEDLPTARGLLSAALHRVQGHPVFIDVNTDFPGAVELVEGFGLIRQRELVRMRLGPDAGVGRSRRVFAIAGPAVG